MNKKSDKLNTLEKHAKNQAQENDELRLRLKKLTAENEQLLGKLQFMEVNGGMEASSNIGIRMASTMTQMTGPNFGMEDEAGEEFNNTFLSELQKGYNQNQQSFEKPDKYSTKELQIRNSMVPQHLRDSYAIVSLDRSASEQEMKVRIII